VGRVVAVVVSIAVLVVVAESALNIAAMGVVVAKFPAAALLGVHAESCASDTRVA